MQAYLRKHPFLLIVICFIAGILSAGSFPGSPGLFYILAASLLIASLVVSKFGRGSTRSDIQTLLLFLVLLFFGICRTKQQYRENQPNHYSHFMGSEKNEIIGIVSEIGQKRMLVEVERINQYLAEGKLTVFIDDPLKIGERIFFQSKIRELVPPKNPFQFNFKKFYQRKQIWYQSNMSETPLVLNRSAGFTYHMDKLRTKCREVLREVLTTENEYRLALALILGDKRNMGTRMRNAYADTGAMHVLAVSGLHVGVVYMILLFIFRAIFPPAKVWWLLRSLVVLAALWFFVYLVGAPISAFRAALMFSLFELGILASRNYYPVNTLSLAAFVLLILDTNSLYDVGFQLSFLAVLGIVTCQKRIQQAWHIENGIGFKIWQMVSLSLAAQIFTFPLTIFYFHQFPLYFWLSGILAVPFAFMVLLLGLLTLLFWWVPGLNYLLGLLLFGSTHLLNAWIFLVQQLPGMVVEGIWINSFQLLSLLLISCGIGLFLIRLNIFSLRALILSLGVFMVVTNMKRWNQLHQTLLVGYYDRSDQYVDLIIGRKAIPLHTGDQENEIDKKIENARTALGVVSVQKADVANAVFSGDGFFAYRQNRIYIQDSSFLGFNDFPHLSYVFINRAIELKGLDKIAGDPLFCIGTDNDFRAKGYELKLQEFGYRTHNVLRDGALSVALKADQIK